MPDLTVKEVKKRKADLELKLIDIFKEFEKETGLKVTYFNISRERKKDEEPEEIYEPHTGPIKDVEINVDLDLVY